MQINLKFNAKELSELKVPIPPLQLQDNFDSIFKKIRDMLNIKKGLISLHKELLSSIVSKALAGDLKNTKR